MTAVTYGGPFAVAGVIRSEMARLGVTLDDVAAAAGLSTAAICHRLDGFEPLTLEQLDSIAPLLGTRSAELIAEAWRVSGHDLDG